jgi:hypothetical protein
MADVAPKTYCKGLARLSIADISRPHGARYPQIGSPIRHLRDLRENLSGLRECFVDVPERAGTAHAREVEIGCRLALGDIPGPVDTNKEEGDVDL